MKIQLRFFASVREALGVTRESVVVPDDIKTVGDVRDWLQTRGASWSEVLGEGRALRMAYNQEMTEASTAITDGCEVAFFPPVTGG